MQVLSIEPLKARTKVFSVSPRGSVKSLITQLRRVTTGIDYRTRRDQVVAQRLQNAFERDLELARVQGLNFFVQNGVVTLYGTIRHELDRELIISVIRGVAGVREVVEHIQLVEGPAGTGSGDA
jgi:osmotically-inducible protein OsmY